MSEANCKTSAKYCSFKVTFSNDEVQKEVCRFCHRRMTWKFTPTGQLVDNSGYLRAHIRDFCQPGTRVYEELYGREAVRNVAEVHGMEEKHRKRKEDLSDEYDDFMRQPDRKIFT